MLLQPSLYRKDCQVCLQLDDLTASVAAPVSDCADVSVTRESQRAPHEFFKAAHAQAAVEPGLHWRALSLKQPGCKWCSLRLDCENWAPPDGGRWEQEERENPDSEDSPPITCCTQHSPRANANQLSRSCYLRMTRPVKDDLYFIGQETEAQKDDISCPEPCN